MPPKSIIAFATRGNVCRELKSAAAKGRLRLVSTRKQKMMKKATEIWAGLPGNLADRRSLFDCSPNMRIWDSCRQPHLPVPQYEEEEEEEEEEFFNHCL